MRAVHLDMRDEEPQRWLSGLWGREARLLTLEEMDAEIRSGKIDPNTYAPIEWRGPLRQACSDLLDLLPALQALAPSSDDVRFVIGFDS
ncbi:MAG: hypothetical protein ACO1SV_07665 [Fimbriimonas sp.]